jgi:hypothetical protein
MPYLFRARGALALRHRPRPAHGRAPAVVESLERRSLFAVPAVTGLTLINADTDQPVAAFTNFTGGAVLDLAKLPTTRLNVRANVGTGTASVRFGYDANANYRTESAAPFALAGDSGDGRGDYLAWTPTVGTHTIKTTPFSAQGATGTAGATRAVTFTVVPSPSAPAAAAVAPPIVTVASRSTSRLRLNLAPKTASARAATVKYRVSYTPGAYAVGSIGQRKTVEVAATSTGGASVELTGLLSFVLYSIDVAAVDARGKSATTHVNASTTAPADYKRYLYVPRLPKDRQGFTTLKPHIEVFDVAHGHRWVRDIPLPTNIYNVRGVAASVVTDRLYISFFNGPRDTYQSGGLLCLDLKTDAIVWTRKYASTVVPSPDRFDLTPDGRKIFMPVGEHGTQNFWAVIDARTGDVTGRVTHVTAPHNTIVSVDGRRAFLEGQEKGTQPAAWSHTIAVVDTATNAVIKRVGPFRDVVRPFTINGKADLIFATVNNFVGFQVASVTSGKVIRTVAPPGYVQPAPTGRVLSHGILLTPNEKQLWVVDGLKVGLHVWDVSKVRTSAPTYLGFVKTRRTGKDLASNIDPNASQDTDGVPAWISTSYDGRYIYPEGGEIIEVATRRVVGQLRAKTTDALGNLIDAPYTHSRFMLELDFDATGNVVRKTDQFGIGLVR